MALKRTSISLLSAVAGAIAAVVAVLTYLKDEPSTQASTTRAVSVPAQNSVTSMVSGNGGNVTINNSASNNTSIQVDSRVSASGGSVVIKNDPVVIVKP